MAEEIRDGRVHGDVWLDEFWSYVVYVCMIIEELNDED